MGAEIFVKTKKYIAGISDLTALARHSLGSWLEKVFLYIAGISGLAALAARNKIFCVKNVISYQITKDSQKKFTINPILEI